MLEHPFQKEHILGDSVAAAAAVAAAAVAAVAAALLSSIVVVWIAGVRQRSSAITKGTLAAG